MVTSKVLHWPAEYCSAFKKREIIHIHLNLKTRKSQEDKYCNVLFHEAHIVDHQDITFLSFLLSALKVVHFMYILPQLEQ